MSKIKVILKGLSILSKSYAYVKMSQKTGMSIAELDLFNEGYKAISKQTGCKISIFLKEHMKKNRILQAHKITTDKMVKTIEKPKNKTKIKKLLFQDKSLQYNKPNP